MCDDATFSLFGSRKHQRVSFMFLVFVLISFVNVVVKLLNRRPFLSPESEAPAWHWSANSVRERTQVWKQRFSSRCPRGRQ